MAEPLTTRPQCVLVIDDNALNLKLFRSLLTSHGYEVLEAATGNAGLHLAQTHHPDLIVLDLQLPDLYGLEVAIALKGNDETARIPVIATTAFLGDWERDAYEAGCDAFLTKPISIARFFATVASVLRGSKAERDTHA